ncbi:putative Integrin-linked protein kinase 1 [Cocos nucifera]|uniref:Putative Integrin-linked protein kinase 1 n=1 Tax=Cocos nucifera TaxID=13894 RepID=A0A8K0MZS9_COCNU|nr:putative Integrin-linked protein kinase 1 [Cocos nucifera]
MYLASKGDCFGGWRWGGVYPRSFGSDVVVNFKGIDGRTAPHVTGCQGLPDVVNFLLLCGAVVDPKDRRGSTSFEIKFLETDLDFGSVC